MKANKISWKAVLMTGFVGLSLVSFVYINCQSTPTAPSNVDVNLEAPTAPQQPEPVADPTPAAKNIVTFVLSFLPIGNR